ncbi:MAG: acyl carrier protein [Bacteriovoracaceae bacterium]
MEKEILPELEIVFQETLKRKDLKIAPEDILKHLPGMDSLKLIHLVVGIEKRFSMKFSTLDLVNFKQVKDFVEAIHSRKK